MKVHLIQEALNGYLSHLQQMNRSRWYYEYDIVENLGAFDPAQEQILESYDQALQSNVSRRLWRRENFDAKQMMVEFLKMEPDYGRQMFRDLYDESRLIDARIDRFKFYCDELFELYRRKYPKSIQTQHDQDNVIISLYLTGAYPEHYSIYPGYSVFEHCITTFGSPEPLLVDDLPRFFKVSKVLHVLASKSEQFQITMQHLNWNSELHPTYRLWTTHLMRWLFDKNKEM